MQKFLFEHEYLPRDQIGWGISHFHQLNDTVLFLQVVPHRINCIFYQTSFAAFFSLQNCHHLQVKRRKMLNPQDKLLRAN